MGSVKARFLELHVIRDLERERVANCEFADEFLRCGRKIENVVNRNVHNVPLTMFLTNDIPLMVASLVDIKLSIKNAMDQLPDEGTKGEIHRFIQFEHGEELKFEAKHKEIMNAIKRDGDDSEEEALAGGHVTRLFDLYNDHIEIFQWKLAEIKVIRASKEQDLDHLPLTDDEWNEDDHTKWIVACCVALVVLLFVIAGISWWMQKAEDDPVSGGKAI